MKRMLKKLAALALSGAMVLSLSVTALADSDYGDTEVEGTGSIEGVKEEDVIVVTVPTVSDAQGYTNAIVDPFNLIQRSGGYAYNGEKSLSTEGAVNPFKTTVTKKVGNTETTEAVSHLMYFKNTAVTKDAEGNETSEVTYSGISDEMTITNKSDHAISVALSLETTEGFDSLKMLDAASMDAAATALDAKTEPSIFLALASGSTVKPVLTPGQVIPTASILDEEGKGYLTGVRVIKGADATEDLMGVLNTADFLSKISFEITATKATNGDATAVEADDFDQKVKVATTLDTALSGDGWSVAGDDNTDKNLYGIFATDSAPAANPTVTIDIKKTVDSVAKTVAQVEFKFDTAAVAEAVKTANATLTVANKFGVSLEVNDGSAVITKDLNWVEDAYELIKTGAGTDGVNNVYRNVMLDAYSTGDKKDDFESLSFQLLAGITAASTWGDPDDFDLEALSYTLTWEIEKCENMGPSARVTTYLTKQASTGTIKYSLGLGSGAATELSTVTYGASNTNYALVDTGTNANWNKTTRTITLNSTKNADIFAAGSVTLHFNNGDDVTVDVKEST
jgi:hypothetical protein